VGRWPGRPFCGRATMRPHHSLKLPERAGPSPGPALSPQRPRSLVGTPKPYQSSDWIPPVSCSSRHLTSAHQLRAQAQRDTIGRSLSRYRRLPAKEPITARPSRCMRLLASIRATSRLNPPPEALKDSDSDGAGVLASRREAGHDEPPHGRRDEGAGSRVKDPNGGW